MYEDLLSVSRLAQQGWVAFGVSALFGIPRNITNNTHYCVLRAIHEIYMYEEPAFLACAASFALSLVHERRLILTRGEQLTNPSSGHCLLRC